MLRLKYMRWPVRPSQISQVIPQLELPQLELPQVDFQFPFKNPFAEDPEAINVEDYYEDKGDMRQSIHS